MSQKIIFITGASSGIGRALAIKYLKTGWKVCGAARRIDLLNKIAEDQNVSTELFLPVECNVQDRIQVHNAVKFCEKKLGPIDCMIANAGIGEPTSGKKYDAAVIENIFRTNVFGAIYAYEAVIPFMISRRSGHLVGISSLASYRGLPGAGGYCSSKAALVSLLESLRQDLKPHHIQVSIINPGFIKTPMTARNMYTMPFILSLEKGAEQIFNAIQSKKSLYSFPQPMATAASLARFLPVTLYDFLLRNRKYIKNPLPRLNAT